MSLMHEHIRSILKEVETFLVETIKNEKLCSSTQKHKGSILDKINLLKKDYPQFSQSGASPNQSVSVDLDESSVTGGSNTEEEGSTSAGSFIQDKAADDIADVTKCGTLDKYKKGGLIKKAKPTPRYCMLRKDVLYIYEKEKQKKQTETIHLPEYELKDGSELVKETSKKEMSFELVGRSNKQVHTFTAHSDIDLIEWKTVLQNGIDGIGEDDMDMDIYDAPEDIIRDRVKETEEIQEERPGEEIYEDVADPQQKVEEPDDVYDDAQTFAADPGEIYDDALALNPSLQDGVASADGSGSSMDLPPPNIPPPPLPRTMPPPHQSFPAPPPEMLNDIEATPPELPPPRVGGSLPPPPPELLDTPPPMRGTRLPSPLPIPTSSEAEPTSNDSDKLVVPQVPRRNSPLLNRPPAPLPGVRVQKRKFGEDDDFENMYYGRWDCISDNNNELCFNSGDVILVINRDFEDKDWWVGKLDGDIGLVPKSYLTEAYKKLNES